VLLLILSSSVLLAVVIEDGVDKSAIVGESGRTMKDDVMFAKMPDSLTHLEEDPGCESTQEWRELRREFYEIPNDIATDEAAIKEYRGARSLFFMEKVKKDGPGTVDGLAKDCVLGLISVLYSVTYYHMKYEDNVKSQIKAMQVLDMYVGMFHPGVFQKYNQFGRLWPVQISDIAQLQREFWRRTGRSVDPNGIGGFDFDTDEDFKVYVYDTDEVPELTMLLEGGSYCKSNQWAAEVVIHQFLLQSKVLTSNPQEADFFFVPQYSSCMIFTAAGDGFRETQSDHLFKKIIKKLPYFEKTKGRDHVFVFSGGHGVDGPFFSWRKYIKDSIFLVIEPELWNKYHMQTEPSYSFHKDILIPGKTTSDLVDFIIRTRQDVDQRKYLADFVGWNRPLHPSDDGSASPREVLLNLANDPRLHIRQDVPFDEGIIGSGSSSFCFIPRGFSAWTSRIFRVMFANCIPVILNDRLEIPFSELLPVHEWTIKWPMKNIDGDVLLNRLEQIRNDTDLFQSMLKAMERDRCWYIFPPSREDQDHVGITKIKPDVVCPEWRKQNAFLATMKLLGRKKRVSKSADGTFYFPSSAHNGTILYTDRNFKILA